MGWDGSFDHERWVGTDHLIWKMDWSGSFDHGEWIGMDHLIMRDGLGRII